MGDPELIFIKGLALFERRTLYANIVNDRNAVFYTTWISKTDPFIPLDKKAITYLEGYKEVILDPDTLVIPRKPDTLDQTFYRSFGRGFNVLSDRLPVLLYLIIVTPLSSVAFFILSGYWTLRSSRRIHLYKRGLASIQPSDYPVPLPIKGALEATVNSNNDSSYQGRGQGSALGHEESQKLYPAKHIFHILALAPYQFCVIDTLDRLGWHKYAVHIPRRNSHAAIIVRNQKQGSSEGYDVFRHWLDKEFMLFENAIE